MELFTTFEKLRRVVVVVDNHAHMVIEIGTFQIQITDEIVREAHGVRYVLSVHKNMISVRALESHGHNVTMESWILNVKRSSLVVMKGVGNINLHRLD